MSKLEQKKVKSTAVQLFLAFAIQLNATLTTMESHWKYKKIKSFKTATKFSTPSSESTAPLVKKIFNINQLLQQLTL